MIDEINEAIGLYLNSSFDIAAKVFQSIAEENPEDQTTGFSRYRKKKSCNNDSDKPAGVIAMLSK